MGFAFTGLTSCLSRAMFLTHSQLSPRMQTTGIERADYGTWTLSDFGILGGSWNQSPVNSEQLL